MLLESEHNLFSWERVAELNGINVYAIHIGVKDKL